jgi:hypothetical protein
LIKSTGIQLASAIYPTYNQSMYYKWNLLGRKLTYTLDISQVPCSCVAAVYFSLMPGYNSNKSVDASSNGNYYCDANQYGGIFCP